MSQQPDPYIVKIRNVRLSFPSLFEPKKGPEENSKAAYAATFLLDKKANAADIKAIQNIIDLVIKNEFKGVRPGKICLRDGSEKSHLDGYTGDIMFVAARNEQRQGVVDRDGKTPILPSDNKVYAGCYVNAVLRLWAQNNKYGKRVNAALGPIQFVKEGEAFGATVTRAEDHFENLSDESPV